MSRWATAGGVKPLKSADKEDSAPGNEFYTMIVHYPGLHPQHFIPMVNMMNDDGEPIPNQYKAGTYRLEEGPCEPEELINRKVQNWKTTQDTLSDMKQECKTACNSVKTLINKGRAALFFHNAAEDRCSLFLGEHVHILFHSEETAGGKFRRLWDHNAWKNVSKNVKAARGYVKSQEVRHLPGLVRYLKQAPRLFMGCNDNAIRTAYVQESQMGHLPELEECITETVLSEKEATSSKRTFSEWDEQVVTKKRKSEWGDVVPVVSTPAVAQTEEIKMAQPAAKVINYGAVDDFARVLKVLMNYFNAFDKPDMYKRISERAGDEADPKHMHYVEVWKRLALRSTVEKTMKCVRQEIESEWINKSFLECITWYCEHTVDSDEFEEVETSFHIFVQWCKDQNLDLVSFVESIIRVVDRKDSKLNTICLVGESNAGKSFIISYPLAHILRFVGQPSSKSGQSQFLFAELPNKRVVIMDEAIFNPAMCEDMKLLLGGEKLKTEVKYGGAVTVDRTPIILTSNKNPWLLCPGTEEAFMNRCHYHYLRTVPELEHVKKQMNPRMWWYLYQIVMNKIEVFDEMVPAPEYQPPAEEEEEQLN